MFKNPEKNHRKLNIMLSVLMAVLAMIGICSCGKTEEDSGFNGNWIIGTGSSTGNYFNFGSVLCDVVNEVTGANIAVCSTGGSTENARQLGTGEIRLALIQSDVLSYAATGTEIFAGSEISNISVITCCYPEMVQLVVRADSGIQSVEDLRGKKVCVGDIGSGYEVAARQILDVYGMSYGDIEESFDEQSAGREGIMDGTYDAMILCSGYPNSNVTQMAESGIIELISIDKEHLKLLTEKYPFYTVYEAGRDEENGCYNLGHSVSSVAVMSMMVCTDDFTENQIYTLTKAIYENLDEIKKLNGKAEYMSLQTAFDGVPVKLHKGAVKYYEEVGLSVPENLK